MLMEASVRGMDLNAFKGTVSLNPLRPWQYFQFKPSVVTDLIA